MSAELADLLESVEEAAIVRPGDTLVLRLGEGVSAEQFARFRDGALPALKERLPDVELLLVGGVEQMVVHRPGEGDGP
ncbi:hypothetical protein ACWEQG_01815 [Microbispora sp. NPDC004025]